VRLKALSGKVVKLTIEGLPIPLAMQIHLTDQGLRLSPVDETLLCDTYIKGTPINLVKSGLISSRNIALLGEDITISGDIALGQQIRSIFDAMEIDWEGQLAHLVGNVAAHTIGNFARKTQASLKNTLETTQSNVAEYVKEEIRLSPPPVELNDFLDEVDSLRDDVERLIKRIAQVESQLKGEP
jgi:ubiquinone biosynthesis protein UbiJ